MFIDESTTGLSPSAAAQSPYTTSPKTFSGAGSAMWARISSQTQSFQVGRSVAPVTSTAGMEEGSRGSDVVGGAVVIAVLLHLVGEEREREEKSKTVVKSDM
ncbi:hypothetical protein Q7P35_010062 [Cladosporium inversicolor]